MRLSTGLPPGPGVQEPNQVIKIFTLFSIFIVNVQFTNIFPVPILTRHYHTVIHYYFKHKIYIA